MEWSAVINDPILQNLPFKIELNRWSKILMSPATNDRGRLQYQVGKSIDREKGSGQIIMECSIQTRDGVKVADVVWASDQFVEQYGYDLPYRQAPEICVELVSPSKSEGEIQEKVQLYLEGGSVEVWVVSEEGATQYFGTNGEMAGSQLVDGRWLSRLSKSGDCSSKELPGLAQRKPRRFG